MIPVPRAFSTIAFLLLASILASGCLKTRIVTDQEPTRQEAELPWAHGFVFGLVPPVNGPLDVSETCGDAGVSEVYFRQEFVQVLAQGLTGSMYAPQRFSATCAAGSDRAANGSPPSYLLRDAYRTRVQATEDTGTQSKSTKR